MARGAHAGTVAGQADRTSPGAFESVSCPTPELCVAVATGGTGETGGGKVVAIADPLAPAPSLVHTQLDESLDL